MTALSSLDPSCQAPSSARVAARAAALLRPAMDAAADKRRTFEAEVKPLLPGLYRYALVLTRSSADAQDLVQNALIAAYLHRDDFNGEGSLSAWLYRIAKNRHIDTQRSAARRRGLLGAALERASDLLDGLWSEGATEPLAEQRLLEGETRTRALACLASLREPFRTTVFLCDVEELGYAEVARVEGVAVGTVKSRHARGRRLLREAWERSTGDAVSRTPSRPPDRDGIAEHSSPQGAPARAPREVEP